MNNIIVHLDDHQLFSRGFEMAVLPSFPLCRYLHFQYPDDALRFIRNAFSNSEKIDVIVTDINHPGINGYEFSKEVKALKQKYSAITPVMLVTMVSEEHPLIRMGLNEKLFDKYFSKGATKEELVEYIQKFVSSI